MTTHGTRYQVEGEPFTVVAVAARLGISPAAACARLKRASERDPGLTWTALGVGAPPSRQRRMLEFIVALGRPATLAEVVAAIATHEPTLTQSQLANLVAAQLSQLTKAGKLDRIGERNAFTYTPTPTALTDGRGRSRHRKNAHSTPAKAPKPPKPEAAPAPKPPKEKRAPKPAKPIAQPRAKAVIATPGVAPPEKRVGEFRIVDKPAPPPVPNANLTRPREGTLDSAHIAAHIAAFEASGGRVERLPNGLTSQPMKCYLAAQAAARRPHPSNDSDLDADDLVDVA